MQRAFDDDDFEPAQGRRDTELTLGPWVIAGLLLGLALLCGLFFGLGYRMGHGAAQTAAANSSPATPAQLAVQTPADAAHSKPSAMPSGGSAATHDAAAQTPTADGSTLPTQEAAAASNTYPTPSTPPAPPVVHPVLPIQPAAASTGPVVQIAAVSHQEDAEVLVNALRKRGYAVTVSQDSNDSLLHVRIGPFGSRVEADRWKQKLLDDGYNAIVQP
jgi:cell division septation protein DedD